MTLWEEQVEGEPSRVTLEELAQISQVCHQC